MLFLFLSYNVLALTIENQTITYSSVSNSTIRFEQNTTLDELEITNQYTNIYNLSTDGAKFTNINASYTGYMGFYGMTNESFVFDNGSYFYADGNDNINLTINSLDNFTVYSDTTPPNATLIYPTNNTYNSTTSQNLTVNLSDDFGIKNATLYVWNETGEFNQTSTNFISGTLKKLFGVVVSLVEGIYKWWYEVFDWAGNFFRPESNFTLTIDTTIPIPKIAYPINTTYRTNISALNYSYTEINCDSAWYSRNSGATNSSRANCGTNFTSVTSNEGSNNWTLYINDSANNLNSTSISFIIDRIYPKINITYPLNLSYSINVSELNYTYTEINKDSCWYSRDSGETNSTRVACGTNWTSVTSVEGNNNWTVYINDTAGNNNLSSIRFYKDTTNPNVTLLTPIDGGEDTDGTVDFAFNVTDANVISNCSLWVSSVLKQTDTTITQNISQVITLINVEESDALSWFVSCRDEYNNLGNSSIFTVDTKLGGSGTPAGGGGSTPSQVGESLGITNISKRVCELTYNSASRETLKYIEIDDIISILKLETNEDYSFTTIQAYIDNWQPLCSDLINRTLKEKEVCERIYYFIINNNWNYTYENLLNFKNNISEISLSLNLLDYYINNYDALCYDTKYSDKLPQKPSTISDKIFKFDLVNCSTSLGSGLFDFTIPPKFVGLKWGVGELECKTINSLRWIFGYEKEEGTNSYYWYGIRLYIILALLIIVVVILFIKSNRKVDKAIKKYA